MRILHLDIETAPTLGAVWGLYEQNLALNQILQPGYTLCWAAKWHGEKQVHFAKVSGKYGTPKHRASSRRMAKAIHRLMDEADAIVHYNGNKFDIPTLNKEFVLHGLNPPSPSKQIDLLLTCRSRFRFVSNKLDFVAQQLGLGQKVEHKGMDLWHGCMNDRPEDWATMESYNKHDVVLLERVYLKLLPWIKGHPNMALYGAMDKPACHRCGRSDQLTNRGYARTAVGLFKKFSCKCGAWPRSRINLVTPEQRKNLMVEAA